jgi:RNA polymerase sigma-70 factor (ECF subfamily)
MSESNKPKDWIEYRSYLQILAKRHLASRYHAKLDCSDIVQQTLVHALGAHTQYRGNSEAERRGWLRQILVRNIAHATRELHTKKRDIAREAQIQEDIDASSMKLESLLMDKSSSPSQLAIKTDLVRVLANALEELPKDQRRAIELRYWEDQSLQEISLTLGKSTTAVAGLLHRATKKLRTVLQLCE